MKDEPKDEPMDLKDYEGLCEMWKKANQLQGANLYPRVVLYRADFQIHERRGSPRLPHIKEEQEEVTIKQEEEQFSSSLTRLCVKHEDEEDLSLLLLYDTPDRHGYIRALSFQSSRSDPPKPLDCEDFTKEEASADGRQTSSSVDHSENGNIEHRSGGVDFRIHKSKIERRQSTESIVKATTGNEEGGRAPPQCSQRGQSKPSSDDPKDGHGKNTPFSCSDCGISFTREDNLNRHLAVHTGAKPFICTVCKRKFAQKYNLHSHVSAGHPGLFPYSCAVCKKGLSSTKSLKTHMLSHEARQKRDKGEKPVCSECGKSFAKKSNLKVHMRIHTGHYPFSCSVCSQEFIEDRTLQRHMRSHTGERPFSCSECGKEFKQMAHYSSHLRIHSGEKPFSCPVCKRGFYRRTHVTSHMRVHRRQKPFSCKVCYKGFMKKEGYRAHMKIHYVQEK